MYTHKHVKNKYIYVNLDYLLMAIAIIIIIITKKKNQIKKYAVFRFVSHSTSFSQNTNL